VSDRPDLERPLLIWDGDCGFCRASIDRWRGATGDRLDYATFDEAADRLRAFGLTDRRDAVRLLEPDGRATSGAEAVFRAMAHAGCRRWSLRLYDHLPLFAPTAELCYRLVASNRGRITTLLRWWWGRSLERPSFHVSSALFLRLLGVVYLFAFASLWVQLDGLLGEDGILPAGEYLTRLETFHRTQDDPGWIGWRFPTLAWWNASDGFLNGLCAGGVALSLLLLLGLVPRACLALLWLAYLSLVWVGQDFFSFQWDILLLETGFLAIWLAPWSLRSRLLRDRHPPRLAIGLVWWLLFRLMFESGVVKLTWDDPYPAQALGPNGNTWEDLTALTYHYWTQPLPLATSWFVAKLPIWMHKASVLGVCAIEIVLPFLIFGPRRLRHVACAGIAGLMLLISATGNYNFFNLLTLVLALTLVDDTLWPRAIRERITGADPPLLASPTRATSFVLVPLFALVMVLSTPQIGDAVAAPPLDRGSPSLASRMGIGQFFLVNSYGLFRHMTETRPEIVIEGSLDGVDWKPYEFRWKPGDPARRPGFTGPHQPRLDWQMWFEALRLERVHGMRGAIEPRTSSPWFQRFLQRLREGEPAVTSLLRENPFPEQPPERIRVALYRYRFTTSEERRASGNWWHRTLVWSGPF